MGQSQSEPLKIEKLLFHQSKLKTKQIKQSQNEHSFKDFTIEIQDNVHLNQISKLLCKQPIIASNHLLDKENISNKNQIKQRKIIEIQKNKISKLNSTNSSNIENMNFMKNKNSKFQRIQQRKCSLDTNNFKFIRKANQKQNLRQQSEAIHSFKSYILSDKIFYSDYQNVQIKLEDFIALKKQPIRKVYDFVQKIGSGSYGDVYKGVQIKNKQVRAIKIIKKSNIPHDQKKQFFSEMQILKQLDHPNIIKLYQIYQDRRFYYVVTQYCVGGSIIDLIVSKKCNQNTIKTILRQILSALNYMHSLKIAHRDIKLENIVFLNKLSQKLNVQQVEVKIIDFGTATKLKFQVNTTSVLFGTTSYLAPQVIQGYYNQKCDVWSTGVILYILMTGKSPFKSKTKQETLDNILNTKLSFNNPQWQKVDKNCIDLIAKMLDKYSYNRISANEALNHCWFQKVIQPTKQSNRNNEILSNLSKYYRGNNFISKIQTYLTLTKVNQKQRKKITQCFKLLDKNNDGMISIQELKQAYCKITNQSQEEIKYVLFKIDKNNSGKIDLSEFIAAVYQRHKLFNKNFLLEAFDYFDSDRTGFIQFQQLQDLLKGCEQQQIEDLLITIDKNNDFKISKEEFLNYMQMNNSLY